MSKKKFKDTKVGKILTGGFVKGIIKSIPWVGEVASNVLDDNGTESGKVDKKELPSILIRIGIIAVLLYLAMIGKIGWDEAEQAKEFITE